jgi:hypothetical protein
MQPGSTPARRRIHVANRRQRPHDAARACESQRGRRLGCFGTHTAKVFNFRLCIAEHPKESVACRHWGRRVASPLQLLYPTSVARDARRPRTELP